ncbi:hypothetical protein [Methanobrevibacter sp.]|uniref:hypothetical protein n=1 Tax=Methanobrevibacter sp. TaxID=66852 RepID=UPI0025CF4CE2|nr:hypothetical protein [Methanobrevibacter sp.]MBQ2665285.1 hypothetical protein [Methanobrevibacter sp.]
MANKGFILLIVVLVVILALVGIYSVTEFQDTGGNLTRLEVSSEGPFKVSEIVEDIENSSYYEGYDNDTLNWMKSLGDMYVFNGLQSFVIMDSDDAGKLPSEFVTDVAITNIFNCEVVEKRSLGNIEHPKDVYLVENVEYLEQNITYYPV